MPIYLLLCPKDKYKIKQSVGKHSSPKIIQFTSISAIYNWVHNRKTLPMTHEKYTSFTDEDDKIIQAHGRCIVLLHL